MARPYSMDLRNRVTAAVLSGGLSCHKAASRFGVAPSTAIRWLQQVRRTGSAAPGQMGGHKPRKLIGMHRQWLLERCKVQDFTLRELVSELAERGLVVDYRSVWVFVHDEGLSYKKNARGRRAGPSRRGSASHAVATLPGPD